MAEDAQTRPLRWVAAALAAGVLLHADRVPLWIVALAALLIAWRLAAARARFPLPGTWLRLLLAALVVVAVLARFHTLNGLAAGTALLILMAALKLLETHRPRDHFVLVGAGLFLLLAACLDRQNLARTPLYFAHGWLCCAALAVVAAPRLAAASALRLAARSLLLAAPLAVLLFVFFPRLSGSFWALPRGEEAVTGLSDTMSPGSIGELSASYAVAFRVRFAGSLPPPEQRYWRGPVLHDFDGATWQRGRGSWRPRQALVFEGPEYRYRITLEPSRHRWWFALDTPLATPEPNVSLAYDYELVAAQPVAEVTSFEAVSRPLTRAVVPLPLNERREDTALPRGLNPRAGELAHELRSKAGSDPRFVGAVLEYLRTGGFVYSLEPERLGVNQVDDFLFGTRTGFCGHYASAFAWLMRAAGVPARIVTGYLGGEWNPIGGYLVVRQSDAHAWTEVWLDGRGWTRVDPTAVVEPGRLRYGILDLLPRAESVPERLLRGSAWLMRQMQRWDALDAWWNNRVVKFDYSTQLDVLGWLGIHGGGTRELGWGFVIGLLGWLALIAWRLGRGPRAVKPDALARAYARLCRKLAHGGLARAAHQGPLAYAEALAAGRPALAGPAHALLMRYAQLRYGEPVPASARARGHRVRSRRRYASQEKSPAAIFGTLAALSGAKSVALAPCASAKSLQLARAEADLGVRAVAEGLVGAAAAAAQIGRGHPRHHAAGAAHDLEVAAHSERSVGLWIDRQRTIAHRQHVGGTARGLAARVEADLAVRIVAEGLHLRGAAAAQRGAKAGRRAVDLQLSAQRVGTGLPHGGEIYRRCALLPGAIQAPVADRTGGTGVRNLDHARGRHRVRMDPGTLDVGEEHRGRAAHAKARVDAAPGLEDELELLPACEFRLRPQSSTGRVPRRPGRRPGQPWPGQRRQSAVCDRSKPRPAWTASAAS